MEPARHAASGAAARREQPAPARAGAANGRAYTPPPTAQASAAGQALQNGLQTPSFAGREQDFANEKFEAEFRERTNPVSAEQAKAALASLPSDTQRGIDELVSDHGAGAREHLAYQAMGEWSPGGARGAAHTRRRQPRRASASRRATWWAMSRTAPTTAGDTSGAAGRREWFRGSRLGAAGAASENATYEPRVVGDPGVWAREPAGGGGTAERYGPVGALSPATSTEGQPAGSDVGQGIGAEKPAAGAPARKSLPPPREPRGPSPDELFPNG